jgi:hypothetical protein
VTAYETLNDPGRREQYDRALWSRRAPRIVEPLEVHAEPEPMLGPRRGVVLTRAMHQPLQPTRLDGLVDELFRTLHELIAGNPRWPDRA